MAANPTQIKNDIDTELANKGYRGVRTINVIAALKKTVDWVAGAVSGSYSTWLRVADSQPSLTNADVVYHAGRTIVGRQTEDYSNAALQAPSASFDFINGTVGDSFRMPRYQTAPGDGLGGVRYYPFAEIPASAVNTLDFADFELTIKRWDNTTGRPTHIRLYVANRGGFDYEYSGTYLDNPGAAVEAYRQTDGRIVLYLRLDNAFRMATIRMPSSYQVTFYNPIPGGLNVPVGVQVLDTSDVGLYIPIQRQDSSGLLFLTGGLNTAMLLTAGPLPSIANGTANLTAALKAGSNNMAGSLVITTSANTAANTTLLTVTFTKPYAIAPRILITANSIAAAAMLANVAPSNVTPSGFSLACGNVLSGPAAYEFNYLVIG